MTNVSRLGVQFREQKYPPGFPKQKAVAEEKRHAREDACIQDGLRSDELDDLLGYRHGRNDE